MVELASSRGGEDWLATGPLGGGPIRRNDVVVEEVNRAHAMIIDPWPPYPGPR